MVPSPLFSAFYFGTVDHYRLIAQSERIFVDLGEHYERQSYRTRTGIVGPNGKQDLVVSIKRRSGEKMSMHTVGLSSAEPWNRQHVQAIHSAYGQTPWFIHFIDDIEDLLTPEYDRLVDLDLASLRLALKWLQLPVKVEVSNTFVENTDGLIDLRNTLHPKLKLPPGVPPAPDYTQIFADRHGFTERLSIIDLVMNTGPEAGMILRG